MKPLIAWLLLALFAMPLVSVAAEDHSCVVGAEASLDALVQKDYLRTAKDFSPKLRQSLPPAKIEQAWQQVHEAFGAYRSHGKAQPREFQGKPVVVARVDLEKGPLDFVAGCDASNRLTSFLLLLPSALEARAPIAARTWPDGTREQPLSVPSPLGPLRGALALPAGEGPFPGVVLVAGSGPNDLDETIGANAPFRDIAHDLAKSGIATLRYDKRTYDHGAKAASDHDFTVDDEVIDDALAALRLLAEQKQVDPHRVFVLGHSLGGQMAPRIASRDPRLAGVIMLAAPARPLLDVIIQQTREEGTRHGESRAAIDKQLKAIAAQKALLANANPQHLPEGSFDGAPQSWWLSLHDYDQVAVAKTLSLPLLILQGASDFQVSPKNDFDAWKADLAGKPAVTFRLYPGLSHLFTPAGATGTVADYDKPAHVAPKVIAGIASWIKAQPPAQ